MDGAREGCGLVAVVEEGRERWRTARVEEERGGSGEQVDKKSSSRRQEERCMNCFHDVLARASFPQRVSVTRSSCMEFHM